jgi:hypothetical protein
MMITAAESSLQLIVRFTTLHRIMGVREFVLFSFGHKRGIPRILGLTILVTLGVKVDGGTRRGR